MFIEGKRWQEESRERVSCEEHIVERAKETLAAGVEVGLYPQQSLDRWLQSAIIEYTRGQPPTDSLNRSEVDGPITDGGSGADEKVFHEPTPGAD